MVHNYKGFKKLESCLNSLLKANYKNMEIIVVDALSNGIKPWLKERFPQVSLIHFDVDEGIPHRRNIALQSRHPNSKYVVFMDEDIIVTEKWLSVLVDIMETNPSIGAAQPLLFSSHGIGAIDNAGCYIDVFGFPHKNKILNDNKIFDVSYAETAVVIVRSRIINNLPIANAAFDSDYFVHWYDIDFSWKILLSGYRIVLVPDSQVYHERRLSAGSGRLPAKNIFLNTRNKMVTLLKNFSFKSIIKLFPISLILEGIKAVTLLRSNPSHSIAIFKALFWVLKNFKTTLAKHYFVRSFIRKVPDSAILRYFLKPNLLRLFNDLKGNYSQYTKNN